MSELGFSVTEIVPERYAASPMLSPTSMSRRRPGPSSTRWRFGARFASSPSGDATTKESRV